MDPRYFWYVPVFAALLVACHDAPRNNPFDPELTPRVEEVAAQVDTAAGSVSLEWSVYEGDQPFAEYWILRRVQGLVAVDTVGIIVEVAQISFTDTSIEPDLDYVYQIVVVNQEGFEVPSAAVVVRSFSVREVELLEVRSDSLKGTISLRWQPYGGPNFTRYEVWRRNFGQDPLDLAKIEDVEQTTWIDENPLPATEYSYWVKLLAAGKELESQRREISYELPPIELHQVEFSSEDASARLEWTRYQGPRFAAYEVRRKSGDLAEQNVIELEDVQATTHIDTFLDGNTEYTYHVFARTTWEGGIGVRSSERSGRFYGLDGEWDLPAVANNRIQAVDLALDEQDQLYVATTLISTTTARVMEDGIRIQFPGRTTYDSFFRSFLPERLSPIHIAASQGRVYATVGIKGDRILVGVVDAEQRQVEWFREVDANGEFPVGLHVEEEGEVWIMDTQGLIHRFSADGESEEPSDEMVLGLVTQQALPVQHMVAAPGEGAAGNDLFFLLVPRRAESHIVGRVRERAKLFGGRGTFTDGVGREDGHTLLPLILAFDPSHTRLMVLESGGRLQVLNGREEIKPRYITEWGRFGSGLGEFKISPDTAVSMVVDSQGYIYVADGEERIQVFAP